MFIGMSVSLMSCGVPIWKPVAYFGSTMPFLVTAGSGAVGGATCSQWTDQSTGGHSLLQSDPTKRPGIITSPVSGLPALLLDGSNDYMATNAFTLAQPCALILVFRNVTYGTAGVHDIIADGNAIGTMAAASIAAKTSISSAGPGVDYVATVANGVYVVLTGIYNGASSSIRLNGSQVAAGTCGAGAPGGLTLGALAGGNRSSNIEVAAASILEMGVGGATAADLLRLERYLGQFGGVAVP